MTSGARSTDGDPRARLDAWRARGDEARDPVRFARLQALAARAQGQPEPVRRVLEARLAHGVSAMGQWLEGERSNPPEGPDTAAPASASQPGAPGPLGQLVAGLRPVLAAPEEAGRPRSLAASAGAAEPPHRDFFERTWSRLAAQERLARSQAAVPDNAGPLNSERLVHRSLALMREVSPAYLERFLAHAQALAWMEQWVQAQTVPAAVTPAARPRGSGGSRSPARRRG